jgi:hypothetical protein
MTWFIREGFHFLRTAEAEEAKTERPRRKHRRSEYCSLNNLLSSEGLYRRTVWSLASR